MKKSMTDKKTEWGIFQDLKKLGEVELIGGKYYLIDEEKCCDCDEPVILSMTFN